jgi:hypothetical protein
VTKRASIDACERPVYDPARARQPPLHRVLFAFPAR